MIATFLDANIYGYFLVVWGGACLALYVLLLALKFFRPELSWLRFSLIHFGYIGLRVLYGVFLGVGQYAHWSANVFTRPLTYLPLPSDVPLPGLLALFSPLLNRRHGYFIDYMLAHYWLGFLWGLLSALCLYLFLYAVRRLRPKLLSATDLNIFLAGGLIIGWPSILLFIIVVFVVFALHVLWGSIFKKGRIPLYPSVCIGFLIVICFGDRLLALFPVIDALRFVRV